MLRRPAPHLKRLVLPVYLPMLLLSTGLLAPAAAFPQYLKGLGAPVAVVGVVLSLRGFGNLLSDLPGGVILGRVSVRPVMIVSMTINTVCSLLIWLIPSVAAIAVLTLISGAALSMVITGMMTQVRASVPAAERGRALSLVGGSLRVGALIGPVAGGFIADSMGAEVTFLLKAICSAAAIGAFAASGRAVIATQGRLSAGQPDRERQRIRLVDQYAAVREGMRGRGKAVASVGFAVLMLMVIRASRGFVLPLWGASLGMSATLIGSVMSAGAAMDLLLFVPAGVIMDKAGRKVAAGLCIGIFSAGLFLLPLWQTTVGFVLASMLIGVGNGFGAGINMTLGTDLAPSGAVSEFLGIWRFVGDIGQTSGPAIVGGLTAIAGMGPGVVAIAGCGVAGLFVLLFLAPETLHIARRHA